MSFFQALIPAYVIERLFWQERGMTVQMVVYVEIIYSVTVTLLEIPSGILADKFGRKRLIAICGAISVLEFVLLLYARGFWWFAFIVFLSGVGQALASGSVNALLYDSLAYEGKQDDFEKISGRLSSIDTSGYVLAALSGSVLAGYFDLEFNYIISAVSMALAFVIILSIKEPPMLTKPENESALRHAKKALNVFKDHPAVFYYCLAGALLGACMIYSDEFWQIIFNEINIPVVFFGAFSALTVGTRIPGSLLAYKLKNRFSYKKIIAGIIAVNAVGYIAVFLMQNAWCLIPLTLLSLMSGIVEPLVSGYMHHHTDSNIRATVESFSSLGLRTLSMGVGLCFGYVGGMYSIFAAFLVPGAVCFFFFIYFIKKKV
jgi:MFS family permease